MKLISMTDFLDQNLNTGCLASQLTVIHNYKNFLKQKRELWMFVPCKFVDGAWVVLECPNYFNEWLRGSISTAEFEIYELC